LPYLGPKKERASEATLEKRNIAGFVKQLFKRPDFPNEIYVALDDGALAFTGDLIWPDSECETPFDFIPIARIDALVLNIPTRAEFLQKLAIKTLEEATPEAELKFWDSFEFKFAATAENVKLHWE
jgi:hypothetical protein